MVDRQDKLDYWFTCLHELIPWYCELQYQGMSLNRQGKGWLLVVRGKRTGGELVVAFYRADFPDGCLKLLGMDMKAGSVPWKHDKFAQ